MAWAENLAKLKLRLNLCPSVHPPVHPSVCHCHPAPIQKSGDLKSGNLEANKVPDKQKKRNENPWCPNNGRVLISRTKKYAHPFGCHFWQLFPCTEKIPNAFAFCRFPWWSNKQTLLLSTLGGMHVHHRLSR